MINKIKNNISLVIVIIILIILGFFGLKGYKKEADYIYGEHQKYYENCQNDTMTDDIFCNSLYSEPVIKRDTISALVYAFSTEDALGNLEILAPLLIIFASLFEFHKKIRKGFLKNALTRVDYKKFIKHEYLHNIKKYAFIYPSFLAILFVFFYFISGNFDYPRSSALYQYDVLGLENTKYWFIFIPSFLLNFVFHSIFWINIGIYNCKNNKHGLIAVIISYVEYFMIFVLFEFVFEGGIFYGTHYQELFGLANIYCFSQVSLLEMNLFSCFLAVFSTLIVYLAYHNKEKTLIEVGI